MSKIKELKDLINKELLLEIDDYIDELFELIASKNDTINTKEELENTQEFKAELKELLVDLDKGEIDEEEAAVIIEDIEYERGLE